MNAKRAVIAILSFAVIAGCGARTGLIVPDLPNLTPPPCSDASSSVLIHLTPNSTPAPEHVNGITWDVARRCAGDSSGGRLTHTCHVVESATGVTTVSGDCSLTGLTGVFRVASVAPSPLDIGFTLTGPVQGNVCVTATITTVEGVTLTFPPRAWRVQPPSTIPDIRLLSTRASGAATSTIINGSSTLPPAMTTVHGTTLQICPEN